MSHKQKKSSVKKNSLFSALHLPQLCFSVDGNHTIAVVDVGVFAFLQNILCWGRYEQIRRCFLSPQLVTTKVDLEIKGINIKLSLSHSVPLLYILRGEMGASTYNILLINGNKKKARRHRDCSRDPFSLCALCPLSVLCYLFWCSNLSQVNNILCCLKLCVGEQKGPPPFAESTCLWLFTRSHTPR